MSTDYNPHDVELLNYYEVLQVSPKAEPEIIEAAYRRLAFKYHPDHNTTTPDTAERMSSINQAYAILKDPERRAEYDKRSNDPIGYYADEWDDYDPLPKKRWKAPDSFWSRAGWLGVGVISLILVLILVIQNVKGNEPFTPTSEPQPAPTLPANVVFFDNFESKTGPNWAFGPPWHLTSRYSASGKQSLWFGEEARGRYAPNLSATATLIRRLDLSGIVKPSLEFQLSGQSDHDQNPIGEDRLFVEIAQAGQDYQVIFNANGVYPNWQTVRIDLEAWKDQQIQLRFRFTSGSRNSGAGFSGFFIDDVRINR